MPAVRLDGIAIPDWNSFHHECRNSFGFPDFYGRNMDAWIDCLSTLHDGDGMTKFTLGPNDTLQIELLNADILRRRAPEILAALEDCVAEVNERYLENGEKPALTLVFR